MFYYPDCGAKSDIEKRIYEGDLLACANFIYDLNGSKGPNTVGKDIGFMTAFNANEPDVVSPIPVFLTDTVENWMDVSSACTKYDSLLRVPSVNEAIAISLNEKLTGKINSTIMTNSRGKEDKYFRVYPFAPQIYVELTSFDETFDLMCIKR